MVGRTLPGNIRILEGLGETPEGPLYRAQYPTGLEAVLVILRRDRNDRRPADASISQLRLQRQLRQATQIKHPNVAAVHETGETSDGLVYVVMEQLAGELLSTVLALRGTVSLREALDLTLQAAAGLKAAHEVGVLHGNLSPSAILITGGEKHARVKLIRFSPVSFSADQESNGQVDKTAAGYASPERLQGNPPDKTSDVFSLGAVLHHLLTGAPPRGGQVGAVPAALHPVLTRALDPSPAQRFQTIAEFAEVLERAAAARLTDRTAQSSLRRSLTLAGVAVAILAALWLSGSLRRQSVGAARPVAETVTRAPPAPKVGRLATPQRPRRAAPPARASAAAKQSSVGTRSDDLARQPQLSPFRRSHPWAAVPGQRFYFRSSCPLALRSAELVYFKSAEEARAAGYVLSLDPGCR